MDTEVSYVELASIICNLTPRVHQPVRKIVSRLEGQLRRRERLSDARLAWIKFLACVKTSPPSVWRKDQVKSNASDSLHDEVSIKLENHNDKSRVLFEIRRDITSTEEYDHIHITTTLELLDRRKKLSNDRVQTATVTAVLHRLSADHNAVTLQNDKGVLYEASPQFTTLSLALCDLSDSLHGYARR